MNPALEPDDAKLYYDLWIPLLDYVNRTFHVNPKLGRMTGPKGLDTREVKVVSDYLWNHAEIIDKYLTVAELPDVHKEIISGWKHFVSGRFILERHLKKGSVFICVDDGQVYMVCGIYSSWSDMLPGAHLPMLIEATLIPFKGKIIHDSIFTCGNIVFGRSSAEEFKDIYMEAKEKDSILFNL